MAEKTGPPDRPVYLEGSRSGEGRVTAIWLSQNTPKPGWCRERDPHTWLGTASAGGRRAAV